MMLICVFVPSYGWILLNIVNLVEKSDICSAWFGDDTGVPLIFIFLKPQHMLRALT